MINLLKKPPVFEVALFLSCNGKSIGSGHYISRHHAGHLARTAINPISGFK
jgi:hypothetical protein